MLCWMCHTGNVKQRGRCMTCADTRCLTCGGKLRVFVRMIGTVKFRKKQWKNTLYDHAVLVKTHNFQRICVNPICPKHWDAGKLPPNWQEVKQKPVLEKKTFEQATAELEQQTHEQSTN